MEYVIKAENLWKIYPDGTKALRGVNFTLRKGEFVGIMGPSGSGKSTLIHLLGGLDKPTQGKVFFMERDISLMTEEELTNFRRGKVAYIFQFYYLLEDFTVLENLLLIGDLLGIKSAQQKALDLLTLLRLSHRLNHKPYQLSGGEQQRVAIGRALMAEPTVIFADEPTGNIDWEEGKKIFDIFKKLNEEKGISFVVATHNPELSRYFNRIVKLRDGVSTV